MSAKPESDFQPNSEEYGRPEYASRQVSEELIDKILQELLAQQSIIDEYQGVIQRCIRLTANGKRRLNEVRMVLRATTEEEVVQKAVDVSLALSLATDLPEISSTLFDLEWQTHREADGTYTLNLPLYRDFITTKETLLFQAETNYINPESEPDDEAEGSADQAEPEQTESPIPTSNLTLPASKLSIDALMMGRVLFDQNERRAVDQADRAYEEINEIVEQINISADFDPFITYQTPLIQGRPCAIITLELSYQDSEVLKNLAESVCRSIKQIGVSPEIFGWLKESEMAGFDELDFDQETGMYRVAIKLYQNFQSRAEFLTRHSWN